MSRRTGSQPHTLTTAEERGESAGLPPAKFLAIMGGGLLLSALVLLIATGSWLVALAFILASGVMLGGVVMLDQMRGAPASEGTSAPDWSVTVAAIERAGEAIAITDRANRMVCANPFFLDSFGANAAPPGSAARSPGS